MVMIIVEDDKKEELEVVLGRAGVVGYTEISRATGRGESGPRLGSGAFPRTSAVVFSILSDAALAGLRTALREFCADCGERLKVVAWDVAEVS
jgi:hypothetical protein